MAESRTRVAVVFGGRSSEHSVSCASAGSVLAHLDRSRFEVLGVGITPEGAWVLGPSETDKLSVTGRSMPEITEGTALALPGDPTAGGLLRLDAPAGARVFSGVDVVFPVLHGAYGEDGTIQGLLEMAGIPYAGAGVLASSVAMDKEFAKKLLAADGLPGAPYAVLGRAVETLDAAGRQGLGLPAFVKPARAGSSTGITLVSDWNDLDPAIDLARRIDPKVIVEAAVTGREVECGVLEFPDGRVEASLPAEIRMTDPAHQFYDYESKYVDAATSCEIDIPATLDGAVRERVRAMAIRAFQALDCQGLARVDFFVTEGGEPIINEVNTMPGFTATSAYPKMWAATGLDYPELLSVLLDTAVARGSGLR
jgi:D-alanine-D-alanine ligase